MTSQKRSVVRTKPILITKSHCIVMSNHVLYQPSLICVVPNCCSQSALIRFPVSWPRHAHVIRFYSFLASSTQQLKVSLYIPSKVLIYYRATSFIKAGSTYSCIIRSNCVIAYNELRIN